jgi:hypothetical protein
MFVWVCMRPGRVLVLQHFTYAGFSAGGSSTERDSENCIRVH